MLGESVDDLIIFSIFTEVYNDPDRPSGSL